MKLLLFIFFSYFIFFFLLPPFQHPDEQGHYETIYWTSTLTYPNLSIQPINHLQPGGSLQQPFADIVQRTQYLPNYSKIKSESFQKLADYPKAEKDLFVPLAIQSYNPPLYYLVGAIFFWFAKTLHTPLLTQFYIVRLTSGLFYFATIFIAYKALLLIFKKRNVAVSLTLFFALNPLLMQSGIGISSDIAVVFFTTLFFYTCIALGKLSANKIILLALIAGLAMLSRATGIILIPAFTLYLYFQEKKKSKFLKLLLLFGVVLAATQIPWSLLNYIRYHTPVMAGPVFGEIITNSVVVSIPTAIVSTFWNLRHIFMHFSGFLGWNEAFPFPPIFVLYTVALVTTSTIGILFSWKRDNADKLMATCIGILLLLFLVLDVIRKVHSGQGWETGGRDALLILFPVLLFTVKGFAVLLHKKVEQIAVYFGYFAIWYYYFILIFVLIPRYYV